MKDSSLWHNSSALMIRTLFVRWSQMHSKPLYAIQRENLSLTEISRAYCRYKLFIKRATVYQLLFVLFGMVFFALAVAVLMARLHITFAMGTLQVPLPLAKGGVALVCALFMLLSLYLASTIHPFDEAIKSLKKHAIAQIARYHCAEANAKNNLGLNHNFQKACDQVQRLTQHVQNERYLIMHIAKEKYSRNILLAELLESFEHQLGLIVDNQGEQTFYPKVADS